MPAINVGSIDGVQLATPAEAIDALPVVQQQSTTFEGIIGVTFVVTLLVVALFFALITLERVALYSVLKALGARTFDLVAGISVQAIGVSLVALVLGFGLSALLSVSFHPTFQCGSNHPGWSRSLPVSWPQRLSAACSPCGEYFRSIRPKRLDNSAMPALQLTDVSKIYGSEEQAVVALDHVNLIVDNDEMLILIGPSGSGKTTLLTVAGALLRPTSGKVQVGGDDITGLSDKRLSTFRRDRVGFVFQSVNLVPFLTAQENLLVVRQFGGARIDRPAKDRADRLLEELGLGGRGEKPAS